MVEIHECDGRFGAAPSGAPTIALRCKPFAERRQVLSEGAARCLPRPAVRAKARLQQLGGERNQVRDPSGGRAAAGHTPVAYSEETL
jgi:hypothetical protein